MLEGLALLLLDLDFGGRFQENALRRPRGFPSAVRIVIAATLHRQLHERGASGGRR